MTNNAQGTPIKVVLAKLGLDGHDRGVKIVARAFRDAGMEVVYMGMRVTPEQVAQTALQEDANAVGISVLSGAHMRLMSNLTRALEDRQLLGNVLLLLGGTIPQKDVERLQTLGVDGVFPVGTFTQELVDFIKENVHKTQNAP